MYVGLDVHKKHTWATAVDESGKIVREEKFPSSGDGLIDFVR